VLLRGGGGYKWQKEIFVIFFVLKIILKNDFYILKI
jgi:hypothetical protein